MSKNGTKEKETAVPSASPGTESVDTVDAAVLSPNPLDEARRLLEAEEKANQEAYQNEVRALSFKYGYAYQAYPFIDEEGRTKAGFRLVKFNGKL